VISCTPLEPSKSSIKTKENDDSIADQVIEKNRFDSSKISQLEKDDLGAKTDYPQNKSKQSENGIRKKAFSCPKCNYSSSLRVKLRFHLKRSH